jgi:cysteine synthase/rhodanese-related sulfurtransferase
MNEHQHDGVFSGPCALCDFLNPAKHPTVPLVELPEVLNPFAADGVRIFAKMMSLLPLGNVKSIPAYAMLEAEAKAGRLKDVEHLIENSSGNTVMSLAVIGKAFGIPHTKAIVSNEVSPGKLALLQVFGVDVTVKEESICPDPEDENSGIHEAKKQGEEPGWFNPGQYTNPTNPEAHELLSGPQLWEQTKGELTIFCAGLGTTGTFVGTSAYLKKQSDKIVTVGIVRKPNNPVPGVRTSSLLREIAFDWKGTADVVKEIGTKDAYEKSLALCRHGLMAGPSSGFAYAGLLQFLAEHKNAGSLDRYRNQKGEVVAVFVCPDSPLPYLEEYQEFADAALFIPIQGKELLREKPRESSVSTMNTETDLPPEAAFELAYERSSDGKISLKDNVTIFDIRSEREFQDAYLLGSKRIEMREFVNPDALTFSAERAKTYLLVCRSGERSRIAVSMLRSYGLRAYNLEGGMIAWSERDFPRERPESCFVGPNRV